MPPSSSTETSQPSLSDSPSAPRPQSPRNGASVDGRMAEFHWSAFPGATTYRLQVSDRKQFDELHVDFTVEDTTVTELSGLLPIDNSTWYWRVRAEDATSAWSEPAVFTASQSAEEKKTSAASEKAKTSSSKTASTQSGQAPTAEDEVEVPFHTAQTSSTAALVMGALVIISFAATVVLLMMFG